MFTPNRTRVTERALERFSVVYQQYLNEPDIRSALVGRRLGHIRVADGEVEATNITQRGSIEVVFDATGAGHWCAWFTSVGRKVVFDPALSNIGDNPYPISPNEAALIRRVLGPFVFFDTPNQLQDEKDTWCQTWSLAMLDANMQRTVLEACEGRRESWTAARDCVVHYTRKLMELELVRPSHRDLFDMVLTQTNFIDTSFRRFWEDNQVGAIVTPLAAAQ